MNPNVHNVLVESGCPKAQEFAAVLLADELVSTFADLRKKYRRELDHKGFRAGVLLALEKAERERLGIF